MIGRRMSSEDFNQVGVLGGWRPPGGRGQFSFFWDQAVPLPSLRVGDMLFEVCSPSLLVFQAVLLLLLLPQARNWSLSTCCCCCCCRPAPCRWSMNTCWPFVTTIRSSGSSVWVTSPRCWHAAVSSSWPSCWASSSSSSCALHSRSAGNDKGRVPTGFGVQLVYISVLAWVGGVGAAAGVKTSGNTLGSSVVAAAAAGAAATSP